MASDRPVTVTIDVSTTSVTVTLTSIESVPPLPSDTDNVNS